MDIGTAQLLAHELLHPAFMILSIGTLDGSGRKALFHHSPDCTR